MPNYSLIINSKFRPMTFEELAKPYQMYGEYYAQQEQLASSLAEQAAEWGQKANEATDPITYQKYKSFESDLNAQSDQLLRQGLTPGLRANLQRMRKRYATEINPIREAYNWRLQQMQQQAEGRAKGVVYAGDAATTSLDDYIANPTLVYQSADSNAGYARVANAAQAIARGLSEAKISGNLDEYTKALLIRSGYDASDVTSSVNQAMSDLQGVLSGTKSIDSAAGRLVQELLQNESKAAGIGEWESTSAKQEYLSKVSPALYNLIGAQNITPMDDYGSKMRLQLSNQLAAARESARLSENAADNQRAFTASLYGGTYDPATHTISGLPAPVKGGGKTGSTGGTGRSSGTSYSYSRGSQYFSNGKVGTINKDSSKRYKIGEEGLGDYLPLTVEKTYDGYEIKLGKNILAKYNPIEEGTNIKAYIPGTNELVDKDTTEGLSGYMTGLTAADVRNFIRAIDKNPGSENQYEYGLKDGMLISLEREAERDAKPIVESADALSALEAEMFGYSEDSDGNIDEIDYVDPY